MVCHEQPPHFLVSVTVLDRDGLVKIARRDDWPGPHTIGQSPVDGEE